MKTAKKPPKKTTEPQHRTVATLVDLAEFAGVTPKTAQSWKRMPEFPIEPDGSYSPWKVAQWHLLRSMDVVQMSDEAGLSGPVSPALERWREERFLMARLDRLERQGQLMNRDNTHDFFMEIATVFRSWGGRMGRQFGKEGEEFHCQVLEDLEEKTSKKFGPNCERLDENGNVIEVEI